jgi:hypothetical protein
MLVDFLALLHRQEEVSPAITVERTEQPFVLDHFTQTCHHGPHRFFLYQLRVVDLASGIVQDHDQVIPAVVIEPAMLTPIDMQQHPWHRASCPPTSVGTSFPALGH